MPIPIQIVREPLTLDEVRSLAQAVLLDQGSRQVDLWGINLYPDAAEAERVEFEAMINVRPSQGNRSRSVEDAAQREWILAIVSRLVRE